MKLLLSTVGSATVLLSASAQVVDPNRDYADTYDLEDHSQIIRLEADINGDGKEEVFLSRQGLVNGKAGNIWIVYVATPGGYDKLDKPLTFRQDAFLVDAHPDVGQTTLLAYRPGGAGKGRLVALQLNNGEVNERVCEEIDRGEEPSDFVRRALTATSRGEEVKTVEILRTQDETNTTNSVSGPMPRETGSVYDH